MAQPGWQGSALAPSETPVTRLDIIIWASLAHARVSLFWILRQNSLPHDHHGVARYKPTPKNCPSKVPAPQWLLLSPKERPVPKRIRGRTYCPGATIRPSILAVGDAKIWPSTSTAGGWWSPAPKKRSRPSRSRKRRAPRWLSRDQRAVCARDKSPMRGMMRLLCVNFVDLSW